MKEYEYYNKDGELIYALGVPIEDIIEKDENKNRYIHQLECMIEQLKFKLRQCEIELNEHRNNCSNYKNCGWWI